MKVSFLFKISPSYIEKNWYLSDFFNVLEYQLIIDVIEDEQLRKIRNDRN